MPCLKFIIENANMKELRLLRGKSIECASLIGLAVGSEKVRNETWKLLCFFVCNFTLYSFAPTHLKSWIFSCKHKLVKSFLRAKREDENHDDATEEALIDEVPFHSKYC